MTKPIKAVSEKRGIKILKQAINYLEQEMPTRCKIKHYNPGCLSCRTNITIGELEYLVDLISPIKPKRKKV